MEAATNETGLGVLAITHYSRLLHELRSDHVHVLAKGRIVRSGGPELAAELEASGYAALTGEPDEADEVEGSGLAGTADPFADPLA